MKHLAGTTAVKELRQKKLKRGLPFMVNSADLPVGQCYLEFPDGSIKIATKSISLRDFTIVRVLTPTEKERVRSKYHLTAYA